MRARARVSRLSRQHDISGYIEGERQSTFHRGREGRKKKRAERKTLKIPIPMAARVSARSWPGKMKAKIPLFNAFSPPPVDPTAYMRENKPDLRLKSPPFVSLSLSPSFAKKIFKS